MEGSGGNATFEMAPVATLKEHTDTVTQIVARRQEVHQNSFISSSKDGSIIIWTQLRSFESDDVGPWKLGKRWDICDPFFMGHNKAVTDLSCTGEYSEAKFVSSSLDKSIIVWDLDLGEAERKFHNIHEQGVLSVSISNDGQRICTGSQDRSIKVLEAQSKARPLVFKNAHANSVTRVRFNPAADARCTFSCGGSEIKIWDLRSAHGRCTDLSYRCEEPANICAKRSIEFGTDGLHMVSGGDSEIINLWKFRQPTSSTQILKSIKLEDDSSMSSAKFSRDLCYMAAAKGSKVFIFEMKTYQNVANVQLDLNVEATSIDWSYDGKIIFVGMSDGAIGVFEFKVQVRSLE